jgi:sensor c-di-GMP phosphodiesterase-like protein
LSINKLDGWYNDHEMADFLQSSILPGEAIPRHEHKRMLIVLTIVVIAAVVVVLGYLWKSSKDSVVEVPVSANKTQAQLIAEKLDNSVVNFTQQEAIDMSRKISGSEIEVTDKMSADIAAKLDASVVK